MLYTITFCPTVPLDSVYWLVSRPVFILPDGSEMEITRPELDNTGSLYGPDNTYREGDLYQGRTHDDYLLFMKVTLNNGKCVRDVSCWRLRPIG